MDLKLYYQKIRDLESKIPDAFPVIVSRDTDDGGKRGSCAEVTRAVAAKMIIEGTALMATAEEAKAYREARWAAKLKADQEAEVAKVQVTIVPTAELRMASKKEKEKV